MSSVPAVSSPKQVAIVEASHAATTPKEREFEDFYTRERPGAVAFAERYLSADAAEDAVQLAATELFKRWEFFTPEQRSTALFLGAVRKRVVDELRRLRQYVELTEEVEALPEFPKVVIVSEETAREDLIRWVEQMVARMPARRREVWILVREYGLKYEEAAEALGVSVRTIEVQLRRARDYFMQGLEHGGIRLTDSTLKKLMPGKTEESHDE